MISVYQCSIQIQVQNISTLKEYFKTILLLKRELRRVQNLMKKMEPNLVGHSDIIYVAKKTVPSHHCCTAEVQWGRGNHVSMPARRGG